MKYLTIILIIMFFLFFPLTGCVSLTGTQKSQTSKSPCEANYKSEGNRDIGYKTSSNVNMNGSSSNIFRSMILVLKESGYTIISSDKKTGVIISEYNDGDSVKSKLSVQFRKIKGGLNTAINISTSGIPSDIPIDCCDLIKALTDALINNTASVSNDAPKSSTKNEANIDPDGSKNQEVPITDKNGFDAEVKKAQEQLLEAGFNPGPADGLMGRRSREAIKLFQLSRGLSETGKLDDATVSALKTKKPPVTTLTSEVTSTPSSNINPKSIISSKMTSGHMVRVTGTEEVELKKGADFFSETLTIIKPGTRLQLIQISGQWFNVRTPEGDGYVFSESVKIEE